MIALCSKNGLSFICASDRNVKEKIVDNNISCNALVTAKCSNISLDSKIQSVML